MTSFFFFAAISGWLVAVSLAILHIRRNTELNRLRRYRNAAEGRGYYTQAEVDEAWERLKRVNFDDAIAIETRKGGDVKQAPSRSDESAGRKASPNPSHSNTTEDSDQ